MTSKKKKLSEANEILALEGGKFCLDIAKLVFAGIILTGIMKEDADSLLLFSLGVTVILFFAVYGLYLIRKSKLKKWEA